jgi:anti-anti-sigma factor
MTEVTERATRAAHDGLGESFAVETRPDRDRVMVIPRGELDLATVDAVAKEIDELVARGFDQVVLDLRRTSFMDSTGLRLVISQAAREDVRVSVIDGPDAVSRLFDLTGVRQRLAFDAGS